MVWSVKCINDYVSPIHNEVRFEKGKEYVLFERVFDVAVYTPDGMLCSTGHYYGDYMYHTFDLVNRCELHHFDRKDI